MGILKERWRSCCFLSSRGAGGEGTGIGAGAIILYLPLFGNNRCMKTYFLRTVLGTLSFMVLDCVMVTAGAVVLTACRLH